MSEKDRSQASLEKEKAHNSNPVKQSLPWKSSADFKIIEPPSMMIKKKVKPAELVKIKNLGGSQQNYQSNPAGKIRNSLVSESLEDMTGLTKTDGFQNKNTGTGIGVQLKTA